MAGERWQILPSALPDWLRHSALRDNLGLGTLGLKLCSSRSSASYRCGRKPALSAGDQQEVICCRGLSGDQPQRPGLSEPRRRRWEDSGDGRGQPLLKDCLNLLRPKSELLHHGRPRDAGAVKTRPVTAPCVLASDFRNLGRQPKTRKEKGPLFLTQTRQVREIWRGRGWGSDWPHQWPPTPTRARSSDHPAPRWAG